MSRKKNFLYKYFTNTPIRKSLSGLYAGIFLLPVLIISIIFVSILYSTLKKWEIQHVHSSLVNAEASFNEMLGSVKTFSDRIYVNRILHDVILTEYKSGLDAYLAYANLGYLNDYLQAFREVSSFRIYADNPNVKIICKASQIDEIYSILSDNYREDQLVKALPGPGIQILED